MSPCRKHQDRTDQEAERAEQRANDRDRAVDQLISGRKDIAGQRGDHEQDRSDHVQPGDTPGMGAGLEAEEAPDRENGEDARHQEQRRSVKVRAPDPPVLLFCRRIVCECCEGAEVEAQRAGKLGDGGKPVAIARWNCESASTSAIAGVWACRSCANEAAVKKIEPTKYVTLSAIPPTALTYAGTDPNANNAEPMMNSQAIVLLRSAGLTVMPLSSPNIVPNGVFVALSAPSVSKRSRSHITPQG